MRMVSRICTFLLCPAMALATTRYGENVWALLALLVVCVGAFCGILSQWRASGLRDADSPTTLDIRG